MRVAYVRVDLGDADDNEPPSFTITPTPLLCRNGEPIVPSLAELNRTSSYSELCTVLKRDFQIPVEMVPPAKYFKPTKVEKEKKERHLYRTVPEGAGEPEWRTKARQALLDAVDEASWSLLDNGKVTVNGRDCLSIEELQDELEKIAEHAGGKRKIRSEAYQPDYDVLVKEALAREPFLFHYSRLPKRRKLAR